ncbi:7-cyano-7-deazaguanine synthase [Halostella pelagica]|uniref:7-cyano-7-deazaguanine synthase n=1 Tax=Halostella pelagica TaxID=2583824 RepID=UPI001081E24B|nr:7-cyano-7-deazaguanine synthase [Halostella pelagica]
MTVARYYVDRHPEFHDRAKRELRTEPSDTDNDDYIAITPYEGPEFPGENEYQREAPSEADETIKYDHSIVSHEFQGAVPDIVLDLVEIATATFAVDKIVDREIKVLEDIDESRLETRNIKLKIPVLTPEMESEEMEQLYSEMVSHITRDIIEYEFLHAEPEKTTDHTAKTADADVVSLLSDGLDSTAGIYHNRSNEVDSHYATISYGGGIKSKVEEVAEGAGIDHTSYRITYPDDGELTQFSRGLLHLTFGAVDASAKGIQKLRCFENGIMARFLILSEGWMTTRTVSPRFLVYFNKILETVLPQPVEVENPFVDKTKAEIINKIPETGLVRNTISCPHNTGYGKKNCGLCVPCIIRNIGIIASDHQIPLDEQSAYNGLLLGDFEDQTWEREIAGRTSPSASSPEIFYRGCAEVAYFCRRILEEEPRELADEYPELLDKAVYEQHRRFADNFMNAIDQVAEQNPSIQLLQRT